MTRSSVTMCVVLSAALMMAGRVTAQEPAATILALERMAASGNAEAVYHLGMMYQTGTGVATDHQKAFALFRRAAQGSDPLGSYKVGCYYAGQGEGVVASDPAAALKYKLVAANAGYALAQQDVALLLAERGDTAQALSWLDQAVAQGWSGALRTAASIYNGAPGVPRDAAKTSAYFSLYLDRSDGSAEQRQWLTAFNAKLSPSERARAAAIIAAYHPAPTVLTIKALSGLRAAQALVASAR